jgi:hypothetical protein
MEPAFDPVAAAAAVLAEFAPGDLVPTETISAIVGIRMPDDENDSWGFGRTLVLERVIRTGALIGVLLKTHKVYAQRGPSGSLELIRPGDQIGRALAKLKREMDKDLKSAGLAIVNLDLGGALPDQKDADHVDPRRLSDRSDALNYVDTLRRALNPKSRRLRPT